MFFIIIGVIVSMTIGVGIDDRLQESNEAMVLRYDKKLYGHMEGKEKKDLTQNPSCLANFQDTSLLARQMNQHNFVDEKLLKAFGDVEASYLKPGKEGMEGLTVIDLKTYYWTRRWRQGSMNMGPLKTPGTVNVDIFFCSAGFERHWGICQNYYTHSSLPEDFSTQITKSMRYVETTAVTNPDASGKTLVTTTEYNGAVVPAAG